eukprot:scaffold82700_cov29-Prasinocladus_malaysianus.AAC.1
MQSVWVTPMGPREVQIDGLIADSLPLPVMDSSQVFSQRRPWLHRVLDYEDEVFAGLLCLLNAQSLAANSGTYSESLYGMKRVGLRPRDRSGAPEGALPTTTTSAGEPSSAGAAAGMTRSQRLFSLLASVSLPLTAEEELTSKMVVDNCNP